MKTFKPIGGDKMKTLLIIIALGLTTTLSFASSTTTIASSAELEVTTENFEMEEWMVNLSSWSVNTTESFDLELEYELEDWMFSTKDTSWAKENESNSKELLEGELVVEDWMIEPSEWLEIK